MIFLPRPARMCPQKTHFRQATRLSHLVREHIHAPLQGAQPLPKCRALDASHLDVRRHHGAHDERVADSKWKCRVGRGRPGTATRDVKCVQLESTIRRKENQRHAHTSVRPCQLILGQGMNRETSCCSSSCIVWAHAQKRHGV